MPDLYQAGTWVAVLSALLTWGFLLDYLLGAPWYRSSGGRLFVAGLAVLTITLTLVVARNLGGDFPGHEAARLVIFVAAAVTIATAWIVHRRVRCRARDPHDHGA
ncbi:hypothetical protein [Nocardiopsis sp. NPDC057823]|uniref:putative phage holin n=1 Tax=Nocardiopsis sp. NPDC057823 TaxID=3346256 RepID=UPI00366ACAC1